LKTLICYYSKTGITHKVAHAVREQLVRSGHDVTLLRVERQHEAGFFRSAWESRRKVLPQVIPASLDVGSYDLVIIGFPVWAGSLASPALSLVNALSNLQSKRVALLSTMKNPTGQKPAMQLCETLIRERGGVVVMSFEFTPGRQKRLAETAAEFCASII